jgi:hypothetical protein
MDVGEVGLEVGDSAVSSYVQRVPSCSSLSLDNGAAATAVRELKCGLRGTGREGGEDKANLWGRQQPWSA